MTARYWVAKARPDNNDLGTLLRSKGHAWWSKTKPGICAGDRVFLWAASPALEVGGLAEALSTEPAWDARRKRWQYKLSYVRPALGSPIGIAECKKLLPLKSASFLKAGPMGTFYELDQEQAAALFSVVCAENRGLGRLWAELRGGRRGGRPIDTNGAPFTQPEYLRALKLLESRLTEGQRLMLLAHARAPGRYLDVRAIARAAGQGSPNYTYSQYGRLGRMIATALGSKRRQFVWTRVLADDQRDPRTELVAWTLHAEVAGALAKLGWGLGRAVPDPVADVERSLKELSGITKTTREQLVQARLGQGEFRQALIALWGGCAVTGCSLHEALRASHIKPWRSATRAERLNPDNGLLLTANLDALFDAGLITFGDDGAIRVSSRLDFAARGKLGLRAQMRLRQVTAEQRRFLRWHREHVFRSA